MICRVFVGNRSRDGLKERLKKAGQAQMRIWERMTIKKRANAR